MHFRIDIFTTFPDIFTKPLSHSIIKRAMEKGLAEIHLHDLRDCSTGKHKSVDDYAFGGGAGMVMRVEPISGCIEKLKGSGFKKSTKNYRRISSYNYLILKYINVYQSTQTYCLKGPVVSLCGDKFAFTRWKVVFLHQLFD